MTPKFRAPVSKNTANSKQELIFAVAIACACAFARPALCADSATDAASTSAKATNSTAVDTLPVSKDGTAATTSPAGDATTSTSTQSTTTDSAGAATNSSSTSSTRSTMPEILNSSSNHSTMNSGLKPWPGDQPSTPSAVTPATLAPRAASTDPPPPPGMDAALKLYAAKKWPLAQKSFEAMVNAGTANVQVHQCLANCYYYQRIYSKAQVQFEWIAKNEKHISAKRSAENTARVLKCYRAGVCPANCIKATDPRWHKLPGHGDELWMTFPGKSGTRSWSEHHIGQLVTYVNGDAEDGGTCPTCNGTGTVKILKDGAPPPQQ